MRFKKNKKIYMIIHDDDNMFLCLWSEVEEEERARRYVSNNSFIVACHATP